MKNIENIFDIIEKENIIYEERKLSNLKSKGLYLKIHEIAPIIAIDNSIINNTSIYISILSEELGHHFTTCGNLLEPSKSYVDKLIKHKKENIAKKWAANFLIPDEDFVAALNKCVASKFEMAEYFDVTNELLEYKILSIVHDENKYKSIKEDFMSKEIQYNQCTV